MKLVVLRHGESLWNHENKFCGWIDIKLSAKGKKEALYAAKLIQTEKFHLKKMYTSKLSRSIQTGNIILEELDLLYLDQFKRWELNERHYGKFQGLDRQLVLKEYGEEQYSYIRRNYLGRPPIADQDYSVDERYDGIDVPHAESLKDVMERFIPFLKSIVDKPDNEENDILLITHGSIVRSIIKYFDNVSDDNISKIEIPTGIPAVFELQGGKLTKPYYYLDKELADEAIRDYEKKTFSDQKNNRE